MKTQIETITPDIAAEYLRFNNNNRNIRSGRVQELSECIKRGDWMLTHQGIAFATDGRLIDGQHRLHAIIKAGVPVKMMVTRGCDQETFKAMDLHSKRSFGDLFQLSPQQAAAMTFIAQNIYGARSFGPEQIQLIMGTELGRTCIELLGQKSYKAVICNTAWVVGCAVQCVNGNHMYAKRLYENIRLCNVDDLPEIGKAFIRQTLNGTLRSTNSLTGRREAFSKALVLFDPRKSANAMIRPLSLENAMQMLRDALPELFID